MTEEKHVLESFVARIWLESGPDGDPMWRGHVRHVQGEQESYFQDLAALSEFVERVSGVSGLGSGGRQAGGSGALNSAPAADGKGD